MGVFVIFPNKADAWWPIDSFGRALQGFVDWVITKILYLVLQLAGLLLSFFGQIFDWTLSITHFTSVTAVQVGWGVSRDLVNMFLIFIALFIAFATILRIESYGIKQLLPKLIGVALLINFSLVIAGVVIDFSQVLTQFFIDSAVPDGNYSSSLANALALKDLVSKAPATADSAIQIFISFIIALIFGIALIFCAALCFALGAFLLIIRFVFVWILLIIMPVALFFMILPSTSNIWNKWLNAFFRWVFLAPAYAFFLYLGILTARSGSVTAQMTMDSNIFTSQDLNMPNFLNQYFKVQTIMLYIAVIGILFGGLIMAQQIGIYGAQGAMGVAKWMGRSARGGVNRWVARGMPVASARRIREKQQRAMEAGDTTKAAAYSDVLRKMEAKRQVVGTWLSPTSWQRMWTARSARSQSQSFDAMATGARLDDQLTKASEWLRRPRSRDRDLRRQSYEAQQVRAKAVDKQQSDYSKSIKDEDQLVGVVRGAQTDIELEAGLRQLTNINGLSTYFAKIGRAYNPGEIREFCREKFGEDEGSRIASDITAIAFERGNMAAVGMSKWDDAQGKTVFVANDREQADVAVKRMSEISPEKFMGRMVPDALFERDRTGNLTTKLSITGEAIIRNMDKTYIAKADELQKRTADVIISNPARLAEVKRINNDFGVAIEEYVSTGKRP